MDTLNNKTEQHSFRRMEGFFHSYDNTKLFYQCWIKKDSNVNILIAHGQGEHSESYHRLVDAFDGENYSFYALDFRGHGRSEGKRGYAQRFEDYLEDYKAFLAHILKNLHPNGKTCLLSHSMGGLVQLRTLAGNIQYDVHAQVCSAPLLGLALPVPDFKSKGAKFLNYILPKMTLWNEIKNELLSRDAEVLREFEKDPLRHNQMSPGVFLGMMDCMEKTKQLAEQIKTTSLFQISTQDPVVSTPAAQDFFHQIKAEKKILKLYDGNVPHEIYNDIIRDQAFSDLREFLHQVFPN